MSCKRNNIGALPPAKRMALQPVCAQLASPPTSPKKPKTPASVQDSVYSRAKALFLRGARDTSQTHLTGRRAEASAFTAFLTAALHDRRCSSLYISGAPGTGKTAQVNLSLDALCPDPSRRVHRIGGTRTVVMRVNCMAIARPEHIFHEVYNHVAGAGAGRRRTFEDLYAYLEQPQPDVDAVVLVLDEMDCLVTKDQQVLFQLFHCASPLKSAALATKLVLVGISNALDLTDKFLPRLRSNGFSPEALQFMPYTSAQMAQVVTHKLAGLADADKENAAAPAPVPIMHPAAIQLCCKKCAAVTGDLRKAFDICVKSIDYVEQHVRRTHDTAALTLDSAPKVLITHVAKVCAATFGHDSQAKIRNLNLLQKAVLCCLFNRDRANPTAKPPTVNELYDYYCSHTAHTIDNLLGRLKKGEFLEIVGALEASSTVSLTAASRSFTAHIDSGNKCIKPDVLYDDMVKCVADVGVLKKILLSR